jgi:acetyltransferase-like isoleucine patch superfamily enzyme
MKRFLSETRLYICNHIVAHIPSHTIRLWFYNKVMGFKIGKGSTILMNCSFDCTRSFTIGENSTINAGCRLDNRGGITIGNNVSISSDVVILTADHDMNSSDFAGRINPVFIEDYVWVGIRATILPGVNVEKGAVLAAGSLVTKNINSYQVVGGVPAKFIKNRNNNLSYKVSYKGLLQ